MQSVFLYRFLDEAKLFSAFYLAIEPARFAQIAPAFYFVVFHFLQYTLVNYQAWVSLAKIHYFYVLLKPAADKVRLGLPASRLLVDITFIFLPIVSFRLANGIDSLSFAPAKRWFAATIRSFAAAKRKRDQAGKRENAALIGHDCELRTSRAEFEAAETGGRESREE